jgi:TPR repeat protein
MKLFLCLALVLGGSLCSRLNAAEGQTNSNSQTFTPDLHSVSTNFVPDHFDLISRQGFSELEKQASNGDVNAQYQVGARYAEGEGVESNSISGVTARHFSAIVRP